MAANIKTLVDGGGNQVLPRTWAKAVLTGGGGTVEAKFAEIAGELGGISSAVGKARPNIIGTYPVAAGQTVTAGDVVDVQAEGSVGKTITPVANVETAIDGAVNDIKCARLNDHQFISISCAGNQNSLYSVGAKLCSYNSHSISSETSAVLRSADYGLTSNASVARLSDTKFIGSWVANGNLFAQIGNVNGTAITLGSQYQLSSGGTTYNTLIPLSGTSFFIVYNSTGLKTSLCNVHTDTTIIKAGDTPLPGSTKDVGYVSATRLPDDPSGNKRVCVCFADNADGNKGKAVIATISSTNVVSWGAVVTFHDSAAHISCCLDGDAVVVSFFSYNSTTAPTGYHVLPLAINGSQIIPGDRAGVNNISPGYSTSINAIDGQLVGVYSVPSSSGSAYMMKRTGTSISVMRNYRFKTKAGEAAFISADVLSDHRILIVYSDLGNSNNGTATILEVFGNQIAGGFADTSSQCVALQSGEAGQEIEVIFDGVAELPGAVAGQEITSPGVYGHCPRDGWLWVRPEWESAVCGSYTGIGSTLNREIGLGFTPSAVIVCCERQNNDYVGNFPVGVVHKGRAMYYSTVKVLEITDGGFVVGSSGTGSGSAFNTEGLIYNYIALR